MVYCRSGKHRSVVVALMLEHVLRSWGIDVQLVHLCQWFWSLKGCQKQQRRNRRVIREIKNADTFMDYVYL